MNPADVTSFMSEARQCALVMLESATFIGGELDTVSMTDDLRAQTEAVCQSLIGTKHDIFTELGELDELLDSGSEEATVLSRVDRIVRWLWEDIARMHQLVTALEAASKEDQAQQLAFVLIAESATNILRAYDRTSSAADALHTKLRTP